MSNNITQSSMLRVGTVLHSVYRIDGYLSSGGFGNTYVATNIEFDEQFAVKEFFMKGVSQRDGNNTTVSVSNAENKATFASQLEKFKKEARRLRKLKNEHIVHVYDLFEENGTAYYVMDYVNGENLSERLKRTGVPLSEHEVLRILPQILDALDAAHSYRDSKDPDNKGGILHLDLKPANIMLDSHGEVKLIDFGASKQQSTKGGATTSSAISYTQGYAPREQTEQNLDKFGPWTDFYALGATLYTLLTNKKPPLPSDIDDDETPDKHQSLLMPATVSLPTKRLVLWLMNTNRKQRPQCVDDIRNYLTGNVDSETIIGSRGLNQHNNRAEEETIGTRKQKDVHQNVPKSKTDNPYKKALIIIAIVILLPALCLTATKGCGGRGQKGSSNDSDSVALATKEQHYTEKLQCKVGQGECIYTGYVNQNNVPNGEGEAWFKDGRYYKGNFDNGQMVAEKASFRYPNGDTYEGSFVDDHFSNGKYTIAEDGSYFVGTYDEQGQPLKGTWYDKNGNIIENV